MHIAYREAVTEIGENSNPVPSPHPPNQCRSGGWGFSVGPQALQARWPMAGPRTTP